MEPIEESMTLSPKESIVNILGRLFNNGHISGDELAMMQMELVARNPEPQPISIPDETLQELVNRMREADAKHKRDPQGLRTWGSAGISPLHGSNPFTIPASGSVGIGRTTSSSATLSVYPDADTPSPSSFRYPLGTEYGPVDMYGYIDANKLTDI
ncbi:MAG: hypothetical protein ACR2IJ_10605 [Fluviibacter sp.]|jgi:hypothetical protein